MKRRLFQSPITPKRLKIEIARQKRRLVLSPDIDLLSTKRTKFEEETAVTMPTYGRSGKDWSTGRKAVVTLSKDTIRKRVEKDEKFYITRMIKMNEFDSGIGYNKLEFNHTTGRLPLWLCDLTDFDNFTRTSEIVTNGGTKTTTNFAISHGAAPWYVLNFRHTDDGHDAVSVPSTGDINNVFHEERKALFFERLNYRYELDTSTIGTTGSGAPYNPTAIPYPSTITAEAGDGSTNSTTTNAWVPLSGESPMLKWIDFRGLFYGVKSREVKWNVSIVQFAKDYLDPVPADKFDFSVFGSYGGDKVRDRFQFWYKTAKKLTAHPMLPSSLGEYKSEPGIRYLAKYTFKVAESLNDADQINKVEKRINLRLNKILRKKWKYDSTVPNSVHPDLIYGDGKGLDNPMAHNAFSRLESSRIHPRSRVYLMISATCPKSAEEGADTTTITYTGLDPTKLRNVGFEVPYKYTQASFDGNEWIGGKDGASAQSTIVDPLTVKAPMNVGQTAPNLYQVDAADIDHSGGDNLRTTTGGAPDDVRGQLHITQTVARDPTGADTSASLVATQSTVVADPGRDNPTFDFCLRMKYVI